MSMNTQSKLLEFSLEKLMDKVNLRRRPGVVVPNTCPNCGRTGLNHERYFGGSWYVVACKTCKHAEARVHRKKLDESSFKEELKEISKLDCFKTSNNGNKAKEEKI